MFVGVRFDGNLTATKAQSILELCRAVFTCRLYSFIIVTKANRNFLEHCTYPVGDTPLLCVGPRAFVVDNYVFYIFVSVIIIVTFP